MSSQLRDKELTVQQLQVQLQIFDKDYRTVQVKYTDNSTNDTHPHT